MKTIAYIICFFALLAIMASCKKSNDPIPLPDGMYNGKVLYSSSLGIVYTHTETPCYVQLSEGKYSWSIVGPTILTMPQTGTYTVLSADSVKFIADPTWRMTPVLNRYLNGVYARTYKGDSVILTLNIPEQLATYQYRLLKRN